MIQSQISADSLETVLDNYVDAGNTDQMVMDVSTSYPDEAYEVYSDLMNNSPYLSDTVMEESILKENVLAEAMIRDVLVANPQAAKSDEVMSTLDDRFNPLPDYMISEIQQGINVVSDKESIESMLSHQRYMVEMAKSEIIKYHLQDTIVSNSGDSIINLLSGSNNPSDLYKLAFIYAEMGDSVSMSNTLSSIPTPDDNHQYFVSILNIISNQYENDLNLFGLDSNQLSTLETIVQNSEGLPKVWARNILSWHSQDDYREIIYAPTIGEMQSSFVAPTSSYRVTELLEVFPNPADKYVVISWQTNISAASRIEILGMDGKLYKTINLSAKEGQEVINISSLSSGVYLVKLTGVNISETTKLVIR
ncbi:MAG: T9SS type A sorting domain-containing protein [Bacteroidota bacterium]